MEQPSSDDRKDSVHKPQTPSYFQLIRRLSFWILLCIVSGTSGAALALVLKATPLKNPASALAHGADNLTSFIPTNLARPVNILVLGIDNSGDTIAGKPTSKPEVLSGNSDTMLLVRIQPDTHEVDILSIPRDTLIKTATGIDKINDANLQGGAKQAAQTVSQLVGGLPIDRYIRIDTQSFIQLVDALGGVDITVPKAMDYTDKTQHLNIHLTAGRQRLNGQHLEEYVRFRHDEWGDIGRVQRQQEVLKALLHTLIQPATVGKLPQLLQLIQTNVDTDLSIGEMVAISQTLKDVKPHHLKMVMLPGRFSRQDEYPLSYWISDPQATSSIMSRYFGMQAVAPVTTQSPVAPDMAASKGMAIAVQNATGKPEVGEQAIALLKSAGFTNVYLSEHELDSVPDAGMSTQVIAQRGNGEMAELVRQAIKVGEIQVAATGDLSSDVTLVIESDFAAQFTH